MIVQEIGFKRAGLLPGEEGERKMQKSKIVKMGEIFGIFCGFWEGSLDDDRTVVKKRPFGLLTILRTILRQWREEGAPPLYVD